MSLTRPLLVILVITLLSMGILSVSIRTISKSTDVTGCPIAASDGQVDPSATVAFFNNQLVAPLQALAPVLSDSERQVLGDNTDEKWIEIDLSDQKLTAHQGSSIFLESPISSGLANRTHRGNFNIWYKILSTKMEGGSKQQRNYYYLPNVPYTMFFDHDIGIHGTYWHNNFGHPMSHGCVNAPTPVAEKLFYWTSPHLPEGKNYVRSTPDNPGTKVIVHD